MPQSKTLSRPELIRKAIEEEHLPFVGDGTSSHDAKLLNTIIDAYMKLDHYFQHAPASETHALVLYIKQALLECFDHVVQAELSYYKAKQLKDALTAKNRCYFFLLIYRRMGFFHFKDGKHDDDPNYYQHREEVALRIIDQIGATLGSWLAITQELSDNKKAVKSR